jgi:stalled ribosome alternative rescue factor ArfA
MKCAVHKDLHSRKYHMRVVAPRKGKGSFKRNKRVEH